MSNGSHRATCLAPGIGSGVRAVGSVSRKPTAEDGARSMLEDKRADARARTERGDLAVPVEDHAEATRRLLQRDRDLLPGGHGYRPPERGGRGLREQRQRSSPTRTRRSRSSSGLAALVRRLTCHLRPLGVSLTARKTIRSSFAGLMCFSCNLAPSPNREVGKLACCSSSFKFIAAVQSCRALFLF